MQTPPPGATDASAQIQILESHQRSGNRLELSNEPVQGLGLALRFPRHQRRWERLYRTGQGSIVSELTRSPDRRATRADEAEGTAAAYRKHALHVQFRSPGS